MDRSLPARIRESAEATEGIEAIGLDRVWAVAREFDVSSREVELAALSVPQQGFEVQLGCPAATPMMVAAWQVQEVLKILLGRGQLLRHKMLFMDAEAGTVEVLEIGG
jgi:hypothetical protein